MTNNRFVAEMPKAELHVHLEGTLEPSMLLRLAEENSVDLGFASEADVWAAQDYPDPALPHFLDYHYKCVKVLQQPSNFYDLTHAFIETCAENNVRHVEIMFGSMAHTARGIAFAPMFEAMESARRDATAATGVSAVWIMCIDRERSQQEAFDMLEAAEPYRADITGLGLASYEAGNPPIKFAEAYRLAAERGYRLTAHCDCDQQDSVEHIRQCIDVLGVERIDHGVHALDDEDVLQSVIDRRLALTMCPTWRPSDPEPRRLAQIRRMLDLGVNVSINTDDPSEFASRHMTHMSANVQEVGGYSDAQMIQLARNAFGAAWIDEVKRERFLAELERYAAANQA
jgi:adenosine deaminase